MIFGLFFWFLRVVRKLFLKIFPCFKVFRTSGTSLKNVKKNKLPLFGEFIKLKYGRVRYELKGESSKPLIVLIPGFSIPIELFYKNNFYSKLVNSGFRVLTFDLYGRGYSCAPNVTYNLDLHVDQLQDLLETLKISKVPKFIVGVSMGGGIAIKYVEKYPKFVRKLIIASSVGFLKKPMTAKILSLLPSYVGAIVAYFIMMKMLLNQRKDVEEEMESYLKFFFNHSDAFPRVLYSAIQNSTFVNIGDALPKITQPTLILWGKKDPTCPVSSVKKFEKGLKNCKTKTIIFENEGHSYFPKDITLKAIVNFI